MLTKKYIVILLNLILSISLIASCQVNYKREYDAQNKKEISSQQRFWDSLPKPSGYLNDYEYLFSNDEKYILDSLISGFDKRTTIQIAVITFDTTMTTADSLEALTLRIANIWGVGRKDKNNGITIGISKGYKRMRIQNGYGIEKILTDAETKQIIDTAFIPAYRKGKYFDGTYNGLIALIKILEERSKRHPENR